MSGVGGDSPAVNRPDRARVSVFIRYPWADTYPPTANYTECDESSYPVTLHSSFSAANCQADLTRFFRFPCNGSTCIRDLTELTTDCGGLTASEYAVGMESSDSVFIANYVSRPS